MVNKLVVVIAFFSVIMGMTGIAAANPFNLAIVGGSNPLLLSPGQSIVLDLEGDTFHADDILAIQMYTLTKQVICVTPGCTPGDISVTFAAPQFGPAAAGTVTNADIVTVTRSATPVDGNDVEYTIRVIAGPNGAQKEIGAASRGVTNIPEFPTVALPVAAVIGLVFIFRHRKEE